MSPGTSENHRLPGRKDVARRLRREAASIPPRTPADRYWDVVNRIEHRSRPGNPSARCERREIMAALQDISRADVQDIYNDLLLGNCHVRLGRLNAPVSC